MTIWKFPLEVEPRQTIDLPRGAQVLTVQVQRGQPCLWALVDETREIVPRTIVTVPTGSETNLGLLEYIETYQLDGGALVFHVFEEVPA
jgi:hypothetical protein